MNGIDASDNPVFGVPDGGKGGIRLYWGSDEMGGGCACQWEVVLVLKFGWDGVGWGGQGVEVGRGMEKWTKEWLVVRLGVGRGMDTWMKE